jgi:hypothetical protein
VGEDVGVVAAGLLQGVGQDGEAVERPFVVDGLGQPDDIRGQPGRRDDDRVEGVASISRRRSHWSRQWASFAAWSSFVSSGVACASA